ncbi:hypothetical protein KM043_007370 [Ampulex compressa]|nr:hypothetical protein KM043_007370 [Ampulex compressa]
MPAIFIKDYTWRQTSDFVIVYIPLVGHPKKIDLFLIDDYLKVSFPPFISEIFLWSNVIEASSKCTRTDEKAILHLRKAIAGVNWPRLEIENIDKEFKQQCRNSALERARILAEKMENERNEKRQKLHKAAVKAQIDINAETLSEITRLRDAHREEAMKEFEDFRRNAEMPILNDIEGQLQTNRKAYRPPLKGPKDPNGIAGPREVTDIKKIPREIRSNEIQCREIKEAKEKISSKEGREEEGSTIDEKTLESRTKEKICDNKKDDDSSEDSESDHEGNSGESTAWSSVVEGVGKSEMRRKKKGGKPGQRVVDVPSKGKSLERCNIFSEPTKAVPLPRKTATINVSFSERVFPTPARESSHLDEQEWLAKQAEARRKTGFVTDDLRPEEQDPQWLKDKGDDFFKVGNYLGAINAYTHGIKISDTMASLYVNRSAAQYALGNYYRCLEDCSKALELMEPKCEGNRQSRAKCHARRGAALCKLSAPQHGIPELEAALKLMPDNESIQRDLASAKRYFDIDD